MKKTFWLLFSVASFIAIILYVSNVLIIGDHIYRLFSTAPTPETPVPSQTIACIAMWSWNTLAILGPFALLSTVVIKNICGYNELNIDEILTEKEDRKITSVLSSILENAASPHCVIDIRMNERKRANYILNTGTRADKVDFLKRFYAACEEEAKAETHRYAILAAVSVVLSPKMAGDTIALIIWQCRIVSTILKIYGGRPSVMKTIRIYVKVLMHSFIAGSIDEVFEQFAFGALDVKMLSFLTQALAAVATCIRSASLTRYYIRHGTECDSKEALKEAFQAIPGGIVEVIKSDDLQKAWRKTCKGSVEITKQVANEVGKYVISVFKTDGKDDDTVASSETVDNLV